MSKYALEAIISERLAQGNFVRFADERMEIQFGFMGLICEMHDMLKIYGINPKLRKEIAQAIGLPNGRGVKATYSLIDNKLTPQNNNLKNYWHGELFNYMKSIISTGVVFTRGTQGIGWYKAGVTG